MNEIIWTKCDKRRCFCELEAHFLLNRDVPSNRDKRHVCYLNMLCNTYVIDIELPCKEHTLAHLLTKASPKQSLVQTTVRQDNEGKPRAESMNKHSFGSFEMTFDLTQQSGQPADSLGTNESLC